MALACGHLKIEDLTPGQVRQWTTGPREPFAHVMYVEPGPFPSSVGRLARIPLDTENDDDRSRSLTSGDVSQWTSGPLGPPAPHPAFQHLAVNSCPDNQIPPMIEPHIRQIMLECSPELQVVEVNVPPGFRSEDGWRTCLRDTVEGTCIEALTREDRVIAKEIGKAMIHDDDYKWQWGRIENWNYDKEEEIREQLQILDMEDKEYVIVPNDLWGDEDLGDCSPRPGWEWDKDAGIPSMIRDKMAQIDSEKDIADEEMMKEMARFESETNLHLLRTTPPEDRYLPFEDEIDSQYQGWMRYIGAPYQAERAGHAQVQWYLKERIRCKAEIIRKPPNDRGYALAVCDYGLLHIATKHLCRIPEIGETILATIAPVDVQRKRPFPLTTIYIH